MKIQDTEYRFWGRSYLVNANLSTSDLYGHYHSMILWDIWESGLFKFPATEAQGIWVKQGSPLDVLLLLYKDIK